MLNARVVDSAHWARGRGDVELGFTDVGLKETGTTNPKPIVMYHQGPLLAPAGKGDLPAYTEVAKFDTEVAEKGGAAWRDARHDGAGEWDVRGRARVCDFSAPGADGRAGADCARGAGVGGEEEVVRNHLG